MPDYQIRVFSAQNLQNGSGSQSFGSTNTNSPGSLPGTFTTGAEQGTILTISDTDSGAGANNFNDGTGALQFTAEPLTLTYEQGGSTITTTFPTNTQVQSEFTQTFSNGFTLIALRFEDPNNPGSLVTAGYTFVAPDGTPNVPPPGTNIGSFTSGANNGTTPISDLACFGSGALISTSVGPVRVESLAPGDLVLTYDRGFQSVSHVSSRRVTAANLLGTPMMRPVRIAHSGLVVSAQHRLLLGGAQVELMFGFPEALVPAIAFLDAGLARQEMPLGGLRYHHIALARHEVLQVNGVWVESLLDDNLTGGTSVGGPAARPCLSRREAAVLLAQGGVRAGGCEMRRAS